MKTTTTVALSTLMVFIIEFVLKAPEKLEGEISKALETGKRKKIKKVL